jgi:micrococcal nuclease
VKSKCYLVLLLVLWIVVGVNHVSAESWVWVDKVVDGDTLRLKDGRFVRYIGINAPEIDHASHRADPFGRQALAINKQLAAGKRVRLKQGLEAKDQYGRVLAYVYDQQGRMLNLILIARGMAYFYPQAANGNAMDEVMLSAQRRAMTKRLGIWSALTAGQKAGPFIASRRSRRFHLRQCPFAAAIASKNQVRFNSLWDAYWSGYAPCDSCLASPIKKELKHR